jgi:predicted alpha/beta-fold hydrolase
MCGLADKALRAELNVVLLNQRNCGGTEELSAGLYHSGLTNDPRHVIEHLRTVDRLPAIVVAGYSLGGNLAVKLAGEYGADAPRELLGIAAVSPIIEVAECVRALERRSNLLYEWNFVWNLKARIRRKHKAWPGRYPLERLSRVRSVRSFDDVFTAPHFGFKDADDYYYRASAMRVIDRVQVPALIVAAKDDPFVPWRPFADPKVMANPHITVELSDHGGHCAFVGQNGVRGKDVYWAEHRVIEWATALREAAGREGARFPAPRA